MNQKTDFLKFIAYLQVIGIILVVLGHSFHEYPNSENYGMDLPLYRMMHSFRMPLFMFVSGFLMVYTTFLKKRKKWSVFAKEKVKRLLIPFFTLTIVTFIPRVFLSNYADSEITFSLSNFFSSILDADSLVIPYFWFLQASFFVLVITNLILTLYNKLNYNDSYIYISLIILYAFLPYIPFEPTHIFSINHACNLAIYFILGCCYAKYNKLIDTFIPWSSIYFFLITFIIWWILFKLTENTPYIMVCSIIGILMCISFAKILVSYNIGIFNHLIGANYIIFLLSWYFNIASQQILHHIVELPWWIYTILSLFTGIYIPLLFYRFMEKHPNSKISWFATKFLGQSFKHNHISDCKQKD